MSKEPRLVDDVFVDAVRDALAGTPNSSHPVQFKDVTVVQSPWGVAPIVACTLCGALIQGTEEWEKLHRSNHDAHNKVHEGIETQARRYVSPPRYG